MHEPSRIEVDLVALEHNVATLRRACARGGEGGGSSVALCAVLKADGYGLGAVALARRLERCGVELIAVYTPAGAARLIEAGVTTPLLILMPIDSVSFDGALHQAARAGRVHVAVHSAAQLEALIASSEMLGVRLPVHVEVDTGMSRGGSPPALATALVERIASADRLLLAGVYSHFAGADRDDALSAKQAQDFSNWLSGVRHLLPPGCATHIANTFGVFRSGGFHFDMVRVGLSMLGYASEEFRDPQHERLAADADALRPTVRWTSRVIHIAHVAPGSPVGYGSMWRATRPTRLGLVPVGYADGYPLTLGNKGVVAVDVGAGRWAHAPVVGAVSMDQITIDLTDAPAGVGVGSPVELIGTDKASPTHLPTVARIAGTISHDLLCGLSARVKRTYITASAEALGGHGVSAPTASESEPAPSEGARGVGG